MSPKQDQGSTYLYPKLRFSLWAMHPSDQPSVTPPMSLLPCFFRINNWSAVVHSGGSRKDANFHFCGMEVDC